MPVEFIGWTSPQVSSEIIPAEGPVFSSEVLAHTAEHERTTAEKLLGRLRENGRDAMVREDIQVRKAIDVVAESAVAIPLEQAEAREKIWTPEKEEEEKPSELWTPGDD